MYSRATRVYRRIVIVFKRAYTVARVVGHEAVRCPLVSGLLSRQCMFRERTLTSLRAVKAISDLIRLGDGIGVEKVGKT